MTSPQVFVAVCASAEASVDEAVAALRAAGVGDPLVVRATAGHGLAQARNEALARCDAEVIALVEDDVAVEPGWLNALEAAWAAAGERVACISGPLRARGPEPRPRWLSDAVLSAFGTHDESARTFHGGNISFRAAALRSVSGFWPAHGHPLARDWLGEEHEAQRALARAGWGSAFAPSAAAQRLVTPGLTRRALLRRRFRYGARLALLTRPRAARTAAFALARSAVGVALAVARGDTARSTERATRVAENAGALLGRPLARADAQPVASETPFLATVPPPQPRRARSLLRRERGPLILLYHRVVERDHDPLGLCVSPANFAEQLDVLHAKRELVPLEAVVAGEAGPRAVAVTLDDGYIDNLDLALPALAAARAPATLFVSTGHVARGEGFWWDQVDRLLRAAPAGAAPILTLRVASQERAFPVATDDERHGARSHLHAWLQPLPPGEIAAALESLRAWAGAPGAPAPDSDRPMTIEELRTFAAARGMTIGAHGRSHRSLRHAGPAAQDDEITGSRDDLASWLGEVPTAFSYPFGVPGADVDKAVAARARAAGFTGAVVNTPGSAGRSADRFLLPRRTAPDIAGEEFARWLCER